LRAIDEFRKVMAATGVGPRLVFDLDDPYWERFFGKDGKGTISEVDLGHLFVVGFPLSLVANVPSKGYSTYSAALPFAPTVVERRHFGTRICAQCD